MTVTDGSRETPHPSSVRTDGYRYLEHPIRENLSVRMGFVPDPHLIREDRYRLKMLVGHVRNQRTLDLSACESEERGYGEGGDVYATLMESDTVEPSGRAEGGIGCLSE
jgi:hypothetical protein